MASHDAEHTVRLRVDYTIEGNRMGSTLHYYADATINAAALDELTNGWVTDVLPLWEDCVSDDVQFEQVSAHVVAKEFCPPSIRSLEGQAGDVSGESCPSNLAAVLQLRQTETSGRHNGRIFMSGIPESFLTNGEIEGAALSGPLDALADILILPLNGTGISFYLAVLQRFTGSPPPDPVSWGVTLVRPMPSVSTMRRRKVEYLRYIPTP